MTTATPKILVEELSFCSSIAHDVWNPGGDSKAFESWYFDALSEDGRDAVIIMFMDNFIFSPRYNSINRHSTSNNIPSKRFPAVVFSYYRDGKAVYRAINEFPGEDFEAGEDTPSCRIGPNSFTFKSAPYGSGFFVKIDTAVNKNCHIEAHFEWLSIESDFLHQKSARTDKSPKWNMVVSRADVTGRITASDEKRAETDVIHFRGTGYHDHNSDHRWLPQTVGEWHRGKAHFADSTAVFYLQNEFGSEDPITKLITIKDGQFRERKTTYEASLYKRDKFGLKYPTRQRFVSEDNVRLRIKNQQIIDSSFFYLRFLSEMTLTLRDGKPRKTIGITEYLAPKALKYGWLDWLVNLSIGRREP